jgi:ATP-dependent DNA helicase RecQ
LRALDVDTEGHGGLFLVEEEARPILRGEAVVMLRQDAPRPARRVAEVRERAAAVVSADPHVAARFEALRLWRLAEAKGQGIPPYVIFHDAVLREIAAFQPGSLEALGQVKGVGASKLERYGSRVLGVLSAALPGGVVA